MSCKLSPKETIYVKCQTLFSEEEKIIKLLSVELSVSVVNLKPFLNLRAIQTH